MKNILKIDHIKKTLVMDRTFAKLAENTKSDEYQHLQAIRKDYPQYEVTVRKIKRNPNKKTYDGLTYDYMRNYIACHSTPETLKDNLHEFDELILISKCQSKALRYPTIKNWFFDRYPEIKNFGMPDLTTEEEKTSKIVELAPEKEELADAM